MMWQEARKQERKIRGMLVDYKRRAERRKDYYEKIKADPTQFIQVHGRPCKIHLDPAVAIAGDSPANMMSWQGNHDILIDRFDVRAHLDYIPESVSRKDEEEELTQEERIINYERYRILAQNDFLGVSEEKFLQQLALEEQFGPVEKTEPQPIEGKKKIVGAAIGYNYNEGAATSSSTTVGVGGGEPSQADNEESDEENENEEDEDEDSDIDFDLCVDVNKISSSQAHEMNAAALAYGMLSNDFFSFLTKDVEEAENLKIAREREEEKAMFSGRKSRRERRAFREKKLIGRKLSPPSYAASKAAPIADLIRNVSKSRSRSRSRSVSPPNAGMIQYITSFGGDETPLEPPPPQSIKSSVHSSKEDDNVYKRTVRYRSSRSPEFSKRRGRSRSAERPYGSSNYRFRDSRRKSRSHSPNWRSRSPGTRTVRYHSHSRSPANTRSPEPPRSESHNNTSYRKRRSYSNSRSSTPVQRIVKKSTSPQPVRSIEVPAPPVITRYYGRRKNESSSSELELSDTEDKNDQSSDKNPVPDKNIQAVGNAGGRSKPGVSNSASKLSLQERLKKKRQALINRQYKADKKAERLRQEKAEQERQDREDEMREISIKMRRRERQKRHQYYEMDETNAAEMSDDDRLSSVSSASGSDKVGSDSDHRSRSRSSRKSRNQDRDSERGRNSRERERSTHSSKDRGRDSRRERGRSGERDRDRDRWSRRRDEDRSRRDRSRDRIRDRSRERNRDRSRDRYRTERDRGRDRSRDRDRYSSHKSRERDSTDSSGIIVKAKRPLVDY